MVKWRYSSTHT